MDVKNIIIDDTNGDLAKDLFKNHDQQSALSVWFAEDSDKRVLNLSTNNIKFDSIPNLQNSTFITYLAYNGTLGYTNKVFSTVVAQNSGLFNVNEPSVLVYNPDGLISADTQEELDERVMDIKMYNGQIDVLEYSEGILKDGQTTYKTKTTRSYPSTISSLPNVSKDTVFLDGWYSYTNIIFRQLEIGSLVSKDTFYGVDGFIFKASDSGYFYSNDETGQYYILPEGETLISNGIVQVENIDYEEMLFGLNETSGTSAQANNIYLHSQVLITDELRNAITREIVHSAWEDKNGCDFADWQKLMLTRLSASIMFENELYENAQIILESSRTMCSSGDYESKC